MHKYVKGFQNNFYLHKHFLLMFNVQFVGQQNPFRNQQREPNATNMIYV